MNLPPKARTRARAALEHIDAFEQGRFSIRVTATALLAVFEADSVLRGYLHDNWLDLEVLMSEDSELLDRRHGVDSTIDEHIADIKRELLEVLAGTMHNNLPRRRWRHDE